jgi:imidazolonepropionase-like amidohydrolase
MQETGMTPIQIIVAATKHTAHVCNLAQEIGTLEGGKIADILVINQNPLEDIHALAAGMSESAANSADLKRMSTEMRGELIWDRG